jgi:hypothetical protein
MNTPVLKNKTQPVDAATLAAFEAKRAAAQAAKPASERMRAAKPEREPADPYVWATVATASGAFSAEMRESAADALRATGASVTVRDERPRSQGIPAYVPPPAATRSQNYNRVTIWQRAKNDVAHFSRG